MWAALGRAGRLLCRGLADLLAPPTCLGCRRPLDPHAERDDSPQSAFCAGCLAAIRGAGQPVCPRCAATVGPYALIDVGCSRCRQERYAFDATCSLGQYGDVLRDLVLRLKFVHAEAQAELLGRLLALERRRFLDAVCPELVVPVPLHWWRRLRRGYNQSEAIARGLADTLRLPLARSCLRCVRRTLPQKSLTSKAARRDNVRGAFRAAGTLVQGRTILLVDDVFTTGATLHESARTLRDAGAACVINAVLARAGID